MSRNSSLAESTKRDDEMKKLLGDLDTLQQFCRALESRYRERFTPLFFALPSFRSPAHPAYFDKKTGLPKENFPAIVLPAVEKSPQIVRG